MSGAITPNSSLLKYESPVIIVNNNIEKTIRHNQEQSSKPCRLSKPPADQLEPIRGHTPKPEDILPKILPPQVFEQKGQLWLQKVSAAPAINLDVQRLGEQLDKRLLQDIIPPEHTL
jgi:dynein light intermediate chain